MYNFALVDGIVVKPPIVWAWRGKKVAQFVMVSFFRPPRKKTGKCDPRDGNYIPVKCYSACADMAQRVRVGMEVVAMGFILSEQYLPDGEEGEPYTRLYLQATSLMPQYPDKIEITGDIENMATIMDTMRKGYTPHKDVYAPVYEDHTYPLSLWSTEGEAEILEASKEGSDDVRELQTEGESRVGEGQREEPGEPGSGQGV